MLKIQPQLYWGFFYEFNRIEIYLFGFFFKASRVIYIPGAQKIQTAEIIRSSRIRPHIK